MNPLVALIVSQPGMAERLLAEHAKDGAGRCRVCTAGPAGWRHVWPCTIHQRAVEARDVLRRRADAHSS